MRRTLRKPLRLVTSPETRSWVEDAFSPTSFNVRFHRGHGPAREWDDGEKTWYVHGLYIRTEHAELP